jgi:hypothetical protein
LLKQTQGTIVIKRFLNMPVKAGAPAPSQSASSSGASSASGGAQPAAKPSLTDYTCKQCLEKCQISGSKPAGRDPAIRMEDCCTLNRRNMERRVQKRGPTDQLRIYWNQLLSDKKKLAAWSRKMKKTTVARSDKY